MSANGVANSGLGPEDHAESARRGTTEETAPSVVFAHVPRMPIVPPPHDGEDLASWFEFLALRNGLTADQCLASLGFPQPRQFDLVDLSVRPPDDVIHVLAARTGVRHERLKAMSLPSLDYELQSACRQHWTPCRACEEAATLAAGRPIRLLSSRAPWRAICLRHFKLRRPDDVAGDVALPTIKEMLGQLTRNLEVALAQAQGWRFADQHGFLRQQTTVGHFLRFAYVVNSYVQFRIERGGSPGPPIAFRVVRYFGRDEAGYPLALSPDDRNDLALSLLFAMLAMDVLSIITIGARLSSTDEQSEDPGAIAAVTELLSELIPIQTLRLFLSVLSDHEPAARHRLRAISKLVRVLKTRYPRKDAHERALAVFALRHHDMARVLDTLPILDSGLPSRFGRSGPFRRSHIPDDPDGKQRMLRHYALASDWFNGELIADALRRGLKPAAIAASVPIVARQLPDSSRSTTPSAVRSAKEPLPLPLPRTLPDPAEVSRLQATSQHIQDVVRQSMAEVGPRTGRYTRTRFREHMSRLMRAAVRRL